MIKYKKTGQPIGGRFTLDNGKKKYLPMQVQKNKEGKTYWSYNHTRNSND
jgi:hypothetical protein